MDAQAKQQVAEQIRQATNILVTVSTDPSVDQLAACIGLTLLLNKMNKHATAVFSGKVPSTIEFLQPEKTIETNTDSLRDFIISLDKSKADKLRYKVEDQFVRIFITPYRTSISQKDLEFSQGDFNVEVVMALGVKSRSQLDAAITAHGRILHDAVVVSVNAGEGRAPNLGQLNWQDPAASSLCEMLVSISEAFGSNLIDSQMATAFLTGIVAETERFSNTKTSPKVMTMSAQLMAAGANQQLIASKLQPPDEEPPPSPPAQPKKPDQPPEKSGPPAPPPETPSKANDGSLDVAHGSGLQDSGEVNINPNEILIDEEGNLQRLLEMAEQKEAAAEKAKKEAEEAEKEVEEAESKEKEKERQSHELEKAPEPPVAEEKTSEPEAKKEPPQAKAVEKPMAPPHKVIKSSSGLPEPAPNPDSSSDRPTSMPGSHHFLSPLSGDEPVMETAFTANTQVDGPQNDGGNPDPLSEDSRGQLIGHAPDVRPPQEPEAGPPVDNARQSVANAFAGAPFDAAHSPVQALNAMPMADNLHPGASASQNEPPAPPPVPPPLMPAQGMAAPPTIGSANSKSSVSDTL